MKYKDGRKGNKILSFFLSFILSFFFFSALSENQLIRFDAEHV